MGTVPAAGVEPHKVLIRHPSAAGGNSSSETANVAPPPCHVCLNTCYFYYWPLKDNTRLNIQIKESRRLRVVCLIAFIHNLVNFQNRTIHSMFPPATHPTLSRPVPNPPTEALFKTFIYNPPKADNDIIL